MAPPVDPDDGAAARSTAMHILNGAAQSTDALTRRLVRRGFSPETAAEAVTAMRDYGYVDDAALAGSVAQRRHKTGYGRARIVSDLRSRGLDSETVDVAIGALDTTDDVALAMSAARRVWRETPATRDEMARLRRRVAGVLQRRGWGGDVISSVLRQLESGIVDEN